ncbi:hypothetical protein [Methanoregula sp.]|uniref:hypothetical protein n=1 Tax=Methanoregula sp. TaxID=2052170 RepID=UPI003C725DE2
MRDGNAGQGRDYALSEVIGFILLLGILVTAFALWMVYVVPVNGRVAEITQMNTVKDQFTNYKISLDSLWINSPYGASWNQNSVTVSTSIDLGTGGGDTQASGLFLPMMNPIPSSATLSILNTSDTLNVTYSGPSGTNTLTYPLTILQYQSQNNYWIQQTYYYEDGGVFLTQLNGSVCRVAPPISFVNANSVYLVEITPITLNGIGSMGGNGPVRVDSRLMTLAPPATGAEYWVNTSVTVSNYTAAQMWLGVFNTSRSNGGILDARNYTFGISPVSAIPGSAFMNITGPSSGVLTPDVNMAIQPAQYAVTLNSIVSNLD